LSRISRLALQLKTDSAVRVRRSKPTVSGFTLVEIMIAITIFSIISTFLYSVLTDTLAARQKAEKVMEMNHAGRFFISRITRDLMCASFLPVSKSGSFVGNQFYRDGKARDELHFTGFTRSYFTLRPRTDQAEIGYYFQILDEGPGILMRRESDVIDSDVKIGGEAYEITDRVEEMKIRYFGNSGWVEEWNSTTSGRVMPKAVSVELTLNDGNRSYFFSAIVRIPT